MHKEDYSPRQFFESKSAEELAEYLYDAFERHSEHHHARLDEASHIAEISKSVESDIRTHDSNKSVSHEMWATGVLVNQFKTAIDFKPRVFPQLGTAICSDPAFTDAFHAVRAYQLEAGLKRA